MKPASLLLRYILPALAGVTMGRLIAPESSSPASNSSAAKASDRRGDNSSLPPLPDDPHAIRLAALLLIRVVWVGMRRRLV